MKLHYFQHVPFEGLGSIENWASQKGARISLTRFFADDPLPEIEEIDWLLVMGGPMNIYEHDKYPWLNKEKRFIKTAVESGKMVLGICLGAQLIADVLGAKIYANQHKEIGWFPIQVNKAPGNIWSELFAQELSVMHWHGDTFDLPEGAARIATSQVCLNQGFIYNNRVLGLQFHLESTRESLEALIDHCQDELVEAPYIQTREEMLADESRFVRINTIMAELLDYLLGVYSALGPSKSP